MERSASPRVCPTRQASVRALNTSRTSCGDGSKLAPIVKYHDTDMKMKYYENKSDRAFNTTGSTRGQEFGSCVHMLQPVSTFDLSPVRLFRRVLSAKVSHLSDRRELIVFGGRLAENSGALSPFFLCTSMSCLTYVKKNGLVDTGL